MSDPNKFVAGGYGPLLDVRRIACITCVHRQSDSTCLAFPDGIPDEILEGEHDHRTPFRGDHGIVYSPRAI